MEGCCRLGCSACGSTWSRRPTGTRYALVPDRLRAGTVSVVRLIAWGTIPLAQLAAGLLAERLGAGPSFLVVAAVMLAAAAAATAAPSVRHAPPIGALVPEAA